MDATILIQVASVVIGFSCLREPLLLWLSGVLVTALQVQSCCRQWFAVRDERTPKDIAH